MARDGRAGPSPGSVWPRRLVDITGARRYGPPVTRRSEPSTSAPVRAELGRVRFLIALAVAMVLCLMMVPESLSALASRGASVRADTSAVGGEVQLPQAKDGPALRHGERAPPSPSELRALEEEEESQEKDGGSDMHALASPFVSGRHRPNLRRWLLGHAVAARSGRPSVSTGLGRGPPAC